jgi:Helix-turn-helix domain
MSASTITAKVTLDLAKAIKLDPTLTPAARLVGLFIADHLNTGRGFAWPSQDVIARELGIALRTVQRSMGVLRRHFEIMQRPGVVNEYRPAPRSIRRGYPRRNVGQPLSKCRVTPVKMSGYNDLLIILLMILSSRLLLAEPAGRCFQLSKKCTPSEAIRAGQQPRSILTPLCGRVSIPTMSCRLPATTANGCARSSASRSIS